MALCVAGTACVPDEAPLTDAHAVAIQDSVRAVLDDFLRYSDTARWDSLGALYSDDPGFRFYESGTLQYESATAVRAALASLPPGMEISTEHHDTDIRPLAPGVALVRTLFESTFADSSGAGFGFSGAVTMLWVHEAAGWRILSGHSSTPVRRGG